MIDKKKENEKNLQKQKFIEKNLNIIIKKQIGKGGYGSVHMIMENNFLFALKIFDNKNEKIIRKETELALNCRSSNIIRGIKMKILNYYKQKLYLLFLEFAKFRDLNLFIYYFFNLNILKIRNNTKNFKWIYNFPESGIQYFTYQIINIFKFLYYNSIVHFDIKPANFLLSDNFIIKLTDFSLSELFNSKINKLIELNHGTINYMGPEFYKNQEIFSNDIQKIDYFSFGCILYYMIKRDLLIKKENIKLDDILTIISNGIKDINSMNINQSLKDLVICLLNIDYKKRPNIFELLNNKWINNQDTINKIRNINNGRDFKMIIEFQKEESLSVIKRKRKKYFL